MEVWAAYDARQLLPVTSQMILNFAQNVGNNSNHFFHDDFYVVFICCKFESCTTPSQYSTLWVTWVLNYSFDIGSKFWKFTRCMNRAEVSLSWMTWSLNSSKSAGENSYLPFYDEFDVSSTFCNFVLYEAQPVFSVKSDMRFSENPGDNSFLVIYGAIYILCTFCRFQPGTTQSELSSLWVTG